MKGPEIVPLNSKSSPFCPYDNPVQRLKGYHIKQVDTCITFFVNKIDVGQRKRSKKHPKHSIPYNS